MAARRGVCGCPAAPGERDNSSANLSLGDRVQQRARQVLSFQQQANVRLVEGRIFDQGAENLFVRGREERWVDQKQLCGRPRCGILFRRHECWPGRRFSEAGGDPSRADRGGNFKL